MAHKTRWLVAGFIVGAGMLVCLTSVVSLIVITKTPRFAGTLTPAPPTSGERILFLSYHKGSFDHGPDSWEGSTGHWRINVMRADGSSRGEFAVEPEEATSSAMWSPDGRKVLFGNTQSIWMVNADGGSPVSLWPLRSSSNTVVLTQFPSWSPDGQKIAFLTGGLNVMNADGSHVKSLLPWVDVDMDIKHSTPAWSPDGTQLAVWTDMVPVDNHSVKISSNAIILVNADGSGYSRLTDSASNNTFPSWSPDGQQIAFVSDRDGTTQIYVMNSDGSNPKRLTHFSSGSVSRPTWSPDGSRIAFEYFDPVKSLQIYILDIRSGKQEFLAQGEHPAWSFDSQRIAFDLGSIYLINSDGYGLICLTCGDNLVNRWPSWSPP